MSRIQRCALIGQLRGQLHGICYRRVSCLRFHTRYVLWLGPSVDVIRHIVRRPTRAFMRSLLFFGNTKEIAEAAGLLKAQYAKRGKTISIQDASIAAVYIAYGCTLVTENTRISLAPYRGPRT